MPVLFTAEIYYGCANNAVVVAVKDAVTVFLADIWQNEKEVDSRKEWTQ